MCLENVQSHEALESLESENSVVCALPKSSAFSFLSTRGILAYSSTIRQSPVKLFCIM